MSSYSKIMENVKKAQPPFNTFLLDTFRKREINKSDVYMDGVCKEIAKYFNNRIEYLGYTVLSPEHRLDDSNDPSIKRGFNTQISELILVRFTFKFENELINTHMYLPYYRDGGITIDDTKYYIQLAIMDRVISRITNGIIIKVLRARLRFERIEQYSYTSTKGKTFIETVITTKIYNKTRKPTKKDVKTALLLYPLCKWGFTETLRRLNLTHEDISFVEEEDLCAGDEIVHIKIKDGIFLKSRLELFSGINGRTIVSIVYLLKYYKALTIPDIYNPDATIWKILLGWSIYGQIKPALAHNHMIKHFASVDSYLDPGTQLELQRQGIFCNDIYDLLLETFKNIDGWIANYRQNNLYEKKIGVLELIMSNIVESIFKKIYNNTSDQRLNIKMVRNILRMPSRRISQLYNCGAASGATIINDNALLTIQGKKIQQPIDNGSRKKKNKGTNITHMPEYQFDTSMITVTSSLSIPASNPGDGGFINPYAEIDDNGCLFKPNDIQELEELKAYLPSRSR